MAKVLILRKCTNDRTSHDGQFIYPERGYVEAPDWNGKPECGGGLHGLLWGRGSFNLDSYGSLFQVIEAEAADVIEFNGKCKFRCGNVLLTGSQLDAVNLLKSHPDYPKDNILNYDIQIDVVFAVAGDRSTLTGGDWSTLTGGDWSTLTGGDWSTLKGGGRSTLKGGYESTLTGGNESTLTGGDGSTLTGGNRSVFIIHWAENGTYKVSTKKINKATSGKKFKFTNGKFYSA